MSKFYRAKSLSRIANMAIRKINKTGITIVVNDGDQSGGTVISLNNTTMSPAEVRAAIDWFILPYENAVPRPVRVNIESKIKCIIKE